MTRWTAFAGIVGVVLTALLVLTRLSADVVRDERSTQAEPQTTPETRKAAALARPGVAARESGGEAWSGGMAAGGSPGRRGSETGELERVRTIDPEPKPHWRDAADGRAVRIEVTAGELARSAGVPARESPEQSEFGPHASGGTPNGGSVGSTDGVASVGSDGVDPRESDPMASLSTRALLANVAFSQGLFGVVIIAAAWWTNVPASAFGLVPLGGIPAVSVGLWVGVALWGGSEVGGRILSRYGVDPATGLRETLSPDSRGEWALLLGVVLPVVAGFEEFLFRGVLIGAAAAGTGLSPWTLVVPASVLFALGHSAQGRLGMVVTGLLGGALGGVFVATNSLLVVVVAHYVVNAAEFLVHETGD